MSIEDEREDVVSDDEITPAAPKREEGSDRTDPKKKTLAKVIKEDSTLSPAKVVITALTAVSVAIISTKLTTVLNGLTLAALVAVISAILSEAYRIVTALTAHGVEKAVVPIEKRNLTDRESELRAESDTKDDSAPRRPLAVLREYFARRKNMQLVALFTTTAILTIGTSFLVAKSLGEPSLVSNNYPTEVRAEQLTEKQKQDIIDKAVSEATDSPTLPAPSDPSSEKAPSEKPAEEPAEEKEASEKPVAPKTTDAPSNEAPEEANAPADHVSPKSNPDDTDALRDEIQKLRERLDELEKDEGTSSGPPAKKEQESPSENPKPSSPSPSDAPQSTSPESDVSEKDVEDLQKQIDDLKKELEDRDEEPTQDSSDETELSPQPTTSPESTESSSPAPSDAGRS